MIIICFSRRAGSCHIIIYMGLFEPVWKTNKREKLDEALDAVREINDLKKLREAVLSASLPEVRSAALERITDQRVLREIILENGAPYEIKREAVRRISDPEILSEIAMLRQAYPADGEAIAVLSDQDQLRHIALSEQGGEQDKAVYKIRDQQVLAEIAVDANKTDARKTAIRNITDPWILLQLLAGAEDVDTWSEAYERLVQLQKSGLVRGLSEEQHQALLEAVIRVKDRNVRIGLDEFQEIGDLNRIYREAVRYDLRAEALSKLVSGSSFPESDFPEAWKTAESGRRSVQNTFSNPWQEAEQSIETRIAAAAAADPEMLLRFVRDPALGSEYAATCLRLLFEMKDQDHKKITHLREEAFAAYLRNIPRYAEADKKDDSKEYLLRLAHAVPPEFRDEYGLTVFIEENEQEPEES